MKKIKILHTAASCNTSLGVVKQMQWEKQAAELLGIPWHTVLHTPKALQYNVIRPQKINAKNKLIKYCISRLSFYTWLIKKMGKYDLILLRYSVCDPVQMFLCYFFGKKILTIHHAKETEELNINKNFKGKILSFVEHMFGKITIAYVSGLIAVTPEILDYQAARRKKPVKKFVYFNGIKPSEKPLKLELNDMVGEKPKLLFIASSFSPWHGLDLLLDTLPKSNDSFSLHIVGNVENQLKEKVKNDSRVIFHGLLEQKNINDLAQSSWCGLSSFALYRENLKEACVLKVREYLNLGLPVYASYKDSAIPKNFPYYHIGEPKIREILQYAHTVRSVKKINVYQTAKPFISKQNLLSDLYIKISKEYARNQ